MNSSWHFFNSIPKASLNFSISQPFILHNFQGSLRAASPAVPSMQPSPKIFFTSKFSYLTFCNLTTHKTETGIENRWGTINSEPPGPIIMIGQSETLSRSQIIFITLFCGGLGFRVKLASYYKQTFYTYVYNNLNHEFQLNNSIIIIIIIIM